jgi:hypothetical protein
MKYAEMIFQGTAEEQLNRVQLHLGFLYEERRRLEKEMQGVEISECICREMAKRLIAEMPKGAAALEAKFKSINKIPVSG